MRISDENIASAFEQFTLIAQLHGEEENSREQFEAVRAYMEYLGLNDDAVDELIKQTTDFIPNGLPRAYGWVVMGFLMGLTAAERARQPI